ncbi:MAG: hypothetical protein MUE97_02065 [Phycisphaerales bacterium]|jgi:hypothetical protein|nr:hypothetical protein [Phycisphaerales bacterium]
MLALPVIAAIQPVPAGAGSAAASGLTMPPMWAVVLVVVGLSVLAILTIAARRKRSADTDRAFAQRVAGDRSPCKPAASTSGPHALPDAAADTAALARDLALALDARAERLEHLIAAADDRLARLQRATHAASTTPAFSPPHPPARGDSARPATSPTSSAAQTSSARPNPSTDEPADLTGSIYALADEGVGPVQIAQRLRTHVGKVELILALRAQRAV